MICNNPIRKTTAQIIGSGLRQICQEKWDHQNICQHILFLTWLPWDWDDYLRKRWLISLLKLGKEIPVEIPKESISMFASAKTKREPQFRSMPLMSVRSVLESKCYLPYSCWGLRNRPLRLLVSIFRKILICRVKIIRVLVNRPHESMCRMRRPINMLSSQELSVQGSPSQP